MRLTSDDSWLPPPDLHFIQHLNKSQGHIISAIITGCHEKLHKKWVLRFMII